MAEVLAKGSRITGAQRESLGTELAARYAAGESIRSIADGTGRSFGFVHGLIKESGASLRSRGGATRGAAAQAAKASRTSPAARATRPAGAAAGRSEVAAAAPASAKDVKDAKKAKKAEKAEAKRGEAKSSGSGKKGKKR